MPFGIVFSFVSSEGGQAASVASVAPAPVSSVFDRDIALSLVHTETENFVFALPKKRISST